uniref:Uncharacterized protein LOC108949271 n=1 Tax=Phallusia mammillata TaxID=59560 RepID=A0A6F9DIG3_9ASCI|nr:uncharacterized protein LOC108949271 [Phallusia mammillata]
MSSVLASVVVFFTVLHLTQVTATIRSCVQCDDAVSSGCPATLTSTPCPDSSYDQCTASRTTLYDANGAMVRTVVTRGCSRSSSVRNDECTYSTPADATLNGYFEYTCTRSCTTNGCNTFTPQGTAPGPLYCCIDRSGNNRYRCPIDQGFCYSTVVYRSSASQTGVTHNEVQGYELVSEERGCRATALTSQCSDTQLDGSNAVVTTCQETCQTHGCNDGWPHRPRCLQCGSIPSTVASGSDPCLYNPEEASACSRPYHQYCVYIDQGRSGRLTSNLADNRGGYSRSIVRGCSATDIGTQCRDIQNVDTTFQQCNKTCTADGCNHGMGGSSRPATSLVVLFVTSLLTYVTQSTFSY